MCRYDNKRIVRIPENIRKAIGRVGEDLDVPQKKIVLDIVRYYLDNAILPPRYKNISAKHNWQMTVDDATLGKLATLSDRLVEQDVKLVSDILRDFLDETSINNSIDIIRSYYYFYSGKGAR